MDSIRVKIGWRCLVFVFELTESLEVGIFKLAKDRMVDYLFFDRLRNKGGQRVTKEFFKILGQLL